MCCNCKAKRQKRLIFYPFYYRLRFFFQTAFRFKLLPLNDLDAQGSKHVEKLI